MKTSIYTALLTIIISASAVTGRAGNLTKNDSTRSTECLTVAGVAVDEKNNPIDGAEIKLFKKNDEMEWIEVTNVSYHDHNFSFTLDVNEYYTIEVKKSGFVTRTVGISTMMPCSSKLDSRYRFEFDVTLFKETKGADDYYFDFPVALISYDQKADAFNNNNKYTNHIKAKIKAELDRITVQNMINGKQ